MNLYLAQRRLRLASHLSISTAWINWKQFRAEKNHDNEKKRDMCVFRMRMRCESIHVFAGRHRKKTANEKPIASIERRFPVNISRRDTQFEVQDFWYADDRTGNELSAILLISALQVCKRERSTRKSTSGRYQRCRQQKF